jgi:glucoamylase
MLLINCMVRWLIPVFTLSVLKGIIDEPDPATASIGFVDGKPAGSANPLTWAAGVYVRLMRDIASNRLLEQPMATVNRYIIHHQGQTNLVVTSPVDQSSVSGSPVTVTGTSDPGNAIYLAATNTDNNSHTTTASTTADQSGNFSLTVPVTSGTTVLNSRRLSQLYGPYGFLLHCALTALR